MSGCSVETVVLCKGHVDTRTQRVPFISPLCLPVSRSPKWFPVCVGDMPVGKCKHAFQHWPAVFQAKASLLSNPRFFSFSPVYGCPGDPLCSSVSQQSRAGASSCHPGASSKGRPAPRPGRWLLVIRGLSASCQICPIVQMAWKCSVTTAGALSCFAHGKCKPGKVTHISPFLAQASRQCRVTQTLRRLRWARSGGQVV